MGANALQVSALTCLEHELSPERKKILLGLECFTLLLFGFLIRREETWEQAMT